jgi:hypothetical protein
MERSIEQFRPGAAIIRANPKSGRGWTWMYPRNGDQLRSFVLKQQYINVNINQSVKLPRWKESSLGQGREGQTRGGVAALVAGSMTLISFGLALMRLAQAKR